VLGHARVLCRWAVKCGVLSEHGAGSGEHDDTETESPFVCLLFYLFVCLLL